MSFLQNKPLAEKIRILECFNTYLTAREELLRISIPYALHVNNLDCALAEVSEHARGRSGYNISLNSISSTWSRTIASELAELKKQQAKEKEALEIEEEAQRVVELARLARSALKRKHDGSQPTASSEVSRLHRHAEGMAAACKKLKFE